MLPKNYTTEFLGLEDVNVTDIKHSSGCLDIFLIKPMQKHKCLLRGRETDRVHDYLWQKVKDLRTQGKTTLYQRLHRGLQQQNQSP